MQSGHSWDEHKNGLVNSIKLDFKTPHSSLVNQARFGLYDKRPKF